jgi:hypothetical protein
MYKGEILHATYHMDSSNITGVRNGESVTVRCGCGSDFFVSDGELYVAAVWLSDELGTYKLPFGIQHSY